MGERKKDGWRYCENCFRACEEGHICAELKNRNRPPCTIMSLPDYMILYGSGKKDDD